MTDPYASEWLQSQKKASKKARYIVTAAGIIVLLAVIGGVSYAIFRPKRGGSSEPTGANGTLGNVGRSGDGTPGDGTPTDGNTDVFFTNDGRPVDLKIEKDPALKMSFYGMNYGPLLAIYPWCTNTLGDTIEDMKLVSQLTRHVRVYGMDCNMANYTLIAMKKLGLTNMTLIPTVWVDNNETTYKRQEEALYDLLKEHGADMFAGISVGNEVLFRKQATPEDLYERIATVRKNVNNMGFEKTIPVFTSDLGSNVDSAFVEANDIIMANIHPYFGGVPVGDSGTWTFQFTNDFVLPKTQGSGKEIVISEIGWPTRGKPDKSSVASIDNLQIFLEQFVCQANTKMQTKYYYFEMFDTPWKQAMFTVLEGAWGLFTSDKKLKDSITIPDCAPLDESIKGPN